MSIKKGRVAIITGAGGGIGKTIANRLAEAGANVVIADINEAGARAACEEITAKGGSAIWISGDIRVKADTQKIVQAAVDKWGSVDILVNNAGFCKDAMLHKLTEEQWDDVLDTDLKGYFFMMQAVRDVMKNHGYGRIINMSSNSFYGNVGQANYSSAKAGIIALSNVAALEFARFGVTSNVICPGVINTDAMLRTPEEVVKRLVNAIPLKRMGETDDIAAMTLFFASEEAGYITGQRISVDGGLQTGVHV